MSRVPHIASKPVTRRAFLAVAAAMASTVLGGCSGGSTSSKVDGQTITVTDCVGRQVQVPANPARISCLDSFAGELLVMCGAGPLMVGVPSGVVSDALLQEIYPDLANVPAPMQSGSVNMEEFMAAKPDVAIIKRDVYETAGQASQLDASNVPYVVVGYSAMDEQIAMMRMVGSVAGSACRDKTESLAALFEDTIEGCAKRVEDIPDADRIRVYHAINAVTMTDGTYSLGADWVTAAGGVNVSAQSPDAATSSDYVTSLEQILSWDPDAIICNSADSTDYLLTKDSCASLRAVKDGKVYTIPVGATRWGQRGSVETYLAMLWMGKTLYPAAYDDFDLKEFIVSYYDTYLGLQIDDETYDAIISGRGIRDASVDASSQK